jgi:hypothetical protein
MPTAEVIRELNLEELSIDYRAPLEEVYASLVKAVVTETQYLDIICACQAPGSFARSWVPDWSQAWSHVSLLINNMALVPEGAKYIAHKTSSTKRAVVEFSGGLSYFKVTGVCWNKICVLYSPQIEEPRGWDRSDKNS